MGRSPDREFQQVRIISGIVNYLLPVYTQGYGRMRGRWVARSPVRGQG